MTYNKFIKKKTNQSTVNVSTDNMNYAIEDYEGTSLHVIGETKRVTSMVLENRKSGIYSDYDLRLVKNISQFVDCDITHSLESYNPATSFQIATEGIIDVINNIVDGIKRVIRKIIDKFKSLFGIGGKSSSRSDTIEARFNYLDKKKEELERIKKYIHPEVSQREKDSIVDDLFTYFGEEYIKRLSSNLDVIDHLVNDIILISTALSGVSNLIAHDMMPMVDIDGYSFDVDESLQKQYMDKKDVEYSDTILSGLKVTYTGGYIISSSVKELKDHTGDVDMNSLFKKHITNMDKFIGGIVLSLENSFMKNGSMEVNKSENKITYSTKSPILGSNITTIVESNRVNSIETTTHISSYRSGDFVGKRTDKKIIDDPNKYMAAIASARAAYETFNTKFANTVDVYINNLERTLKKLNNIEKGVVRRKVGGDGNTPEAIIKDMEIDHLDSTIISMIKMRRSLLFSIPLVVDKAMILIDKVIPKKWEDKK